MRPPPSRSMPPPPPRTRPPTGIGIGATPPLPLSAAALPPVTDEPSSPASPAAAAGTQEPLTPLSWHTCFDNATDVTVPDRKATFRVYDAGLPHLTKPGSARVALVLLHGGGHCALTWALVAARLRKHICVIAFDARGHGHTVADGAAGDEALDSDTQVRDAAALLHTFFAAKLPGGAMPRVVLAGHSMGGAIAVRLAATNLIDVAGLVVVDVVEGTAIDALPHMMGWLSSRRQSFPSVESAVRYVLRAGHVRNTESARLSVPAQIQFVEAAEAAGENGGDAEEKKKGRRGRWVWRTQLGKTQQFWHGWFQGLSSLFLSVPTAKMLVLASVNRLDKDLMIAQMQGKFQTILITSAGHTIQEDQPEQTAKALLEYLQRNMFVEPVDAATLPAIFQQRCPIPPSS